MPDSAIVVVVPAAEALVGRHRLRHDPAAAAGVAAHVTILYPFRQPVDAATADVVAAIATSVASFDVTFGRVERFVDQVVYLAPDPDEPFRELTRRCAAAFPDCLPYAGQIPDPIPHLTVADGMTAAVADELTAVLAAGLPIRTGIERLSLLVEDAAGRWSVERHWPLGPARTTPAVSP
jgi:2'-5' RNA ligase superfamily